MDTIRFDHLTRAVARHDRRALFGAVAGLVASLQAQRQTDAQVKGHVELGGTCNDDAECIHGGPYGTCPARDPICGYNGFVSDGPSTCCSDGCCRTDADCCGEMRCISQYEFGPLCMAASNTGHYVGEVCVTNADCVYWPGCEAECVNQRCQCSGQWASRAPDSSDNPLVTDPRAALQAAELIATLEIDGKLHDLYRSMHPDAKALIPADAVIGWYQNEFLHFGEPAPRAVKLRFQPWTWAVTGQTYPESAEVATLQVLADGTDIWDAVRLVKDDNGNWCWFFGKTRQFVVDQLNRFVNPDPNAEPAFLGDPCNATTDCSQSQAAARCVEATREGTRQRVCLYGPNGYCTSTEDCHQEDGRTECVGEKTEGYFSGVCLRAAGASCKSPRDCMDTLTCVAGRCTPAA